MTVDRRLTYLHGKISSLEDEIAQLKAEDLSLDAQMSKLTFLLNRSLLEDRLWSALRHRKSRIPILIDHIQNEILIVQADVDRHHYYHLSIL